MLLKGIIVIVLIVLMVFFGIISLFMMISNWKDKESRQTWILAFVFSIVGAICSSGYLVYKTIEKGIDAADELVEEYNAEEEEESSGDGVGSSIQEHLETEGEELVGDIMTSVFEMTEVDIDSTDYSQMALYARRYEPDSVNGMVEFRFYGSDWFHGKNRLPVVFPYALHTDKDKDYGYLCDERKILDGSDYEDKLRKLELVDVRQFCYDGRFLLAHCADKHGMSKESYTLFHFETEKIERFTTLDDLKKRAIRLGYSIEIAMMPLDAAM